MQVQEEASHRRLSIRPANLRVTHVTGGKSVNCPKALLRYSLKSQGVLKHW